MKKEIMAIALLLMLMLGAAPYIQQINHISAETVSLLRLSEKHAERESFEEAERVGRILGKAAYTVIETAKWKSDIKIRTASSSVEVLIRDFGAEEELAIEAARDKAVYEELYEKYGNSNNREEYCLWQNANLKHLGSEYRLGFVQLQKKGLRIDPLYDEIPAEVQVFLLGDTCVVGVQGEVFVEYALYVKAMAGYGTVIFNELTNGDLPGYLYTPESLVTGGYETDTSLLDVRFGKLLVDGILDTIDKISKGSD